MQLHVVSTFAITRSASPWLRTLTSFSSFLPGSARPGRTLDKDVTVRNHGDADLVIAKVDTTCNCTVVGAYATRIAPGSGTTLRVSLTTPQTPGRTEQAVRIESNDPDQPLAYVDVTATVVAEKTAAGRSR